MIHILKLLSILFDGHLITIKIYKNQQWAIHVYKMGIYMINLIDRKQITLDIYSQLASKSL